MNMALIFMCLGGWLFCFAFFSTGVELRVPSALQLGCLPHVPPSSPKSFLSVPVSQPFHSVYPKPFGGWYAFESCHHDSSFLSSCFQIPAIQM
jgi:hypothetical protein